MNNNYRQVSNIRRTLEGNKIVNHSDVVGASSSFLTKHLASMGWAKATAWWDANHWSFDFGCVLYSRFYGSFRNSHPTGLCISFGQIDNKYNLPEGIISNMNYQKLLKWLAHLFHIDGLLLDCSISNANALEILQSCTKLLICYISRAQWVKWCICS